MVGFAIVGVRAYTGMGNASAVYEIENVKVVEVPKESTEPVTKVYNKYEIGAGNEYLDIREGNYL